MGNMSYKQLSKIQTSSRARVTDEYLGAKLDKQRESIILNMMHSYRAGELSHDLVISRVAQLVALDDLAKVIKNDIRQGEKLGGEK